MTDLTPNDLSHLSDEEFLALCPQDEHAPGPEPLSPSAMAVLDAFLNGCILTSVDNNVAFQADRNGLAAAFCKLADKVAPVWKTPPSGEYELEYGQWIAQNRIRRDILAIATELEGRG